MCSISAGGGVCPSGNTCCRMADGTSGCIPGDLGKFNATCCDDGRTGCGVGYRCIGTEEHSWCQAGVGITDPLVQKLPRYQLCQTDRIQDKQYLDMNDGGALEYYSSHGSVSTTANLKKVKIAVVAIHGAGRNADDYFCATMATRARQREHPEDAVLIVSPRFPVDEDGDMTPKTLRWKDDGAGASWRYGGNSIRPSEISSFAAMDALVEQVLLSAPNLQHVTIIGHSAGGQFSQRWSLLSDTWRPGLFRGAVANPSSYVYLTPLRFHNGGWNIPDPGACPEFNSWEWGLVPHNTSALEPVPYVEAKVESIGIDGLRDRFGSRRMVYLIGSRDECTVPQYKRDGWCYSHGLETTCMDMAQGRNRRERNGHYVASLRLLDFSTAVHQRVVIPNVGHDHSLMFNSPGGLRTMYSVS